MPNPISVAIAAALECPIDHPLRDFVVNFLIDSIREHGGKVGSTALALGVTRRELHDWLESSQNHPDPARRDLSRLFGELRAEHPAQFPDAKPQPAGGHNCPWFITDRAAQDMLRLRRGKTLVDALAELRGYILDIVSRDKTPRMLASGYSQYRSGSPLRCRIIVNPESAPPEVVEVLPDHEGRTEPYEHGSKGRPR